MEIKFKTLRWFVVFVAAAIVFSSSITNSLADTYSPTTEDIIEMQNCIETVRDINSNLKTGENPVSKRDCIGVASDKCMELPQGSTTVGMVTCIARETNWWDGQLNSHYRFLKESLDKQLFSSLRDVQRKWIAYRDASCDFEYESWGDGTIRQPMTASCMLEATASRSIDLGVYVDRNSQR